MRWCGGVVADKISKYNRKLADSQGQDNGGVGGTKKGERGGGAGGGWGGGGKALGLLASALRERSRGPAFPCSPMPRPVPTCFQHGEDVHLPVAPPAHGQNF